MADVRKLTESAALVKAILTAEITQLSDRSRISSLVRNASRGRGIVSIHSEKVVISHRGAGNKQVAYHIPNEFITGEQLAILQKVNPKVT